MSNIRTNLATDPNGVTFAANSWQSNNGALYTVIKESSVGSAHPQGIKTGAVCRSTASNTSSTIASVYGLGNTNQNTGPASWDGVWVYVSGAGYQARWYSASTNYSPVVTLAAATWTWVPTTTEFPANVYHEFGVARTDGTVPPTTDFCFLTGVEMETVALDPTLQTIWGDRPCASGRGFAWTGAENASTSVYWHALAVTANASYSPPRVEIDLSTQDNTLIQSVDLYRVVNGQSELVRTQPATGFQTPPPDFDYECEYNQNAVYTAVGTLLSTALTTIFTQAWANLTGWSTSGASVSGGKLVLAASGLASIGMDGNSFLLNVTGLNSGAAFEVDDDNGNLCLSVAFTYNGTLTQVNIATSSGTFSPLYLPGSPPMNVQVSYVLGSSVTITIGSNVTTIPLNGSLVPAALTIYSNAASSITACDQVQLQEYESVASPFTYTSSQVQLQPTSGWMVHPLTPALSVPISTTDRTLPGVNNLGPVTGASTATVHTILGQKLPIVSSTGPRTADALSVSFAARNLTQEQQLISIVDDQTPILFRFPDPALGWVDGFYSIGDVQRARFAQNTAATPRRLFTLPLQMVQPPSGSVQNPGWSWAALAAQYPSWNAVAQAFKTWAGVAANTPGA